VRQLKNILQIMLFVAIFQLGCTSGSMNLLYTVDTGTDTDTDAGTESDTGTDTDTGCGDADQDGQCDQSDPCPFDFNDDLDKDGLCGNLDNCVAVSNKDQSDGDSDGVGDACDPCPDVNDGEQAPWEGTNHTIPGTIELEFYDEGGQCVAYFDDDKLYRPEIDVFRPDEWIDAHGQQVETPGDYVIGFTYVDEWVEYTVDGEPGTYDITLRYSSEMLDVTQGSVELFLNEALLGTFVFSDTGAFSTFANTTLTNIEIPHTSSGVLRLLFKERYINYTWIKFTPVQ
jgi:hypothetical protein